jgi:hypothetical protein
MDSRTQHDASPITRRTPPNGVPNIGRPPIVGSVYLDRPGNEDLAAAAAGAVRAEHAIRHEDGRVLSQLEMYREVLAQLIDEGLILLPATREAAMQAIVHTANEQSRQLTFGLARMVKARAQQAELVRTMTPEQAKGAEIAAQWIEPREADR